MLAFLTGWLLRASPDRRGPRVAAGAVGWLLAATIVASIAGLAWQLGRYPGELAGAIDQIAHLYFFLGDRIGVVDGARLLEGIGLAAATVMLFRQHPSLSMTLPLRAGGIRGDWPRCRACCCGAASDRRRRWNGTGGSAIASARMSPTSTPPAATSR